VQVTRAEHEVPIVLDGGLARDGEGEEMGESFVENATGVDDASMTRREAQTPDEVGGPFVETTGATEFAKGTDKSNPKNATREPVPRPN
jgi:hypothetical protein